MKTPITIFLLIAISIVSAQNNLYRAYPVPPPTFGYYTGGDMNTPVKTQDKGYIFSYFPFAPNIHGPLPFDRYIIKTDSNLVPQWRKPYFCKAIPLPTGGIILCYSGHIFEINDREWTHIEKITASGVQIWQKSFNDDVRINDGICTGSSVRLVGGKLKTVSKVPYYIISNQPYTMEIDTMGNVISQSLYTTSYGGDADFAGVKRDAQGNFYVIGGYYSMVLAKFNSSFQPLWATYTPTNMPTFQAKDIDILPGGDIMATGISTTKNGYGSVATIVKFGPQGNLQNETGFERLHKMSGLCKKPNGRYAATLSTSFAWTDSLYIFEFDTAHTISNFNFVGKGDCIGTPVYKNNQMYVSYQMGYPYIVSTNSLGSSCLTTPATYTPKFSSIQVSNFTLTPVQATFAIASATPYFNYVQPFADTCKCGPSLGAAVPPFCIGQTGVINASGTGPLSWYATSTSTVPVATGPTYSYTSSTPTVHTVYVETNGCGQIRIPVTFTVNPSPTVAVSSSTLSTCAGRTVQLSAQGANFYSWSHGAFGAQVIISPTTSAYYSVTGTNNYNCGDSDSLAITVHPGPSVTVTATAKPSCPGQSVTIKATGALSYLWNNASTQNSIVVSPIITTDYTVTGSDQLGCTTMVSVTQSVQSCVALNDNSDHPFVKVFPNPTTGRVYVETGVNDGISHIEVYDGTGRLISCVINNSKTGVVDLSEHPSGFYFIKIQAQGFSYVVKVVKE